MAVMGLNENEKVELEVSGDYWQKVVLFVEQQKSGKFLFTNERILFYWGKPEKVTPLISIPYSEIGKVEKVSVGPAFIKFIPTGINITTRNGVVYKLSVLKRDKYIDFINEKLK